MKYTNKYQLKKPEKTDAYNVEDFNDNMDTLDETLYPIQSAVESIKGNTVFSVLKCFSESGAFTVPSQGHYRIIAVGRGGSGGKTAYYSYYPNATGGEYTTGGGGGAGAICVCEVDLAAGDSLNIIIDNQGATVSGMMTAGNGGDGGDASYSGRTGTIGMGGSGGIGLSLSPTSYNVKIYSGVAGESGEADAQDGASRGGGVTYPCYALLQVNESAGNGMFKKGTNIGVETATSNFGNLGFGGDSGKTRTGYYENPTGGGSAGVTIEKMWG